MDENALEHFINKFNNLDEEQVQEEEQSLADFVKSLIGEETQIPKNKEEITASDIVSGTGILHTKESTRKNG